MVMSFDYIVVGAGSAECVVANRLSEKHSVLLLEAGEDDDSWQVRVPPAALFAILNPEYEWGYKHGPESFADDRILNLERGKVMGGSSAINLMAFTRGHKADYDEWAQNTECSEWTFEKLLPFFKKSENHVSRNSEFHGKTGEMQIVTQKSDRDIIQRFLSSVKDAGFGLVDDPNAGEFEGFFQPDYNVSEDGVRQSASTCFIDPIRHRSTLTVQTGLTVDRVIIDDTSKRCTGVQCIREGQKICFTCNKEVVLSAGAFGSPCILQRSGVGPEDLLSSLGIDVIENLPGVGANLLDHVRFEHYLQVKPGYSVNENLRTSGSEIMESALEGLTDETVKQIYRSHGLDPPIPSEELIGQIRTGPNLPQPDVQIYMLPFSVELLNHEKPRGLDLISFIINVEKPMSHGFIHITSREALTDPKIVMNYLKEREDLECLMRGLKISRNIASQRYLKEIVINEVAPGENCVDLESYIRQNVRSAYHPVGTCKMGVPSRDPMAVCDWSGKVAGASGLRVADASIMPTIPAANTNAACIMIGERISDFIIHGL